jgi:hypothetical protein
VWQEAVETAPNGKLTAAHVEAGRNGGQGIEHVRFLLGSEQKVRTIFSLVVNPGKAPLLETKIR